MAEPLNVPAAHAEQPTGPVARRAIHPNFWLEPEARHRVTETAAASPLATRMPAQNMSLDAALPLPLAECLGVMDDKIEHLALMIFVAAPMPGDAAGLCLRACKLCVQLWFAAGPGSGLLGVTKDQRGSLWSPFRNTTRPDKPP